MSKLTKEIRPVLDTLVENQGGEAVVRGRIKAEFKKSGCGSLAMNCSIRSSNVRK